MIARMVLDTNIVVSALLKPQGLEDQVLRLALSGRLKLYLSPAVLAEYARVLPKPKLKLTASEIVRVLTELKNAGTMVNPAFTVFESSHEPDNRFLECAEAAQADFLITGNKRHFPNRWKTTRIVSSRELFQLWSYERIS